jgi:hypothetical protein
MDSEDEKTQEFGSNSLPFLRLYEDEEEELRRLSLFADLNLGSETMTSSHTRFDTQIYVPFRFFGTIKGFHTVGLVLGFWEFIWSLKIT